MESKSIILDESVLNLPLSRIGPNFILNIFRLKSIGYDILVRSTCSSPIVKVLSNDNIFTMIDEHKICENLSSISYITTADKFKSSLSIEIDLQESLEDLINNIIFPLRNQSVNRNTAETKISISVNLDGSGKSQISTGISFFDHMLDQIAKHGRFDLELSCEGDLEVDEHHTIEDTAIALGEAFLGAIGDKKGINRYAFIMPMDESKCELALDLSGRPFLEYDVSLKREYVGDFPTEMTKHFFYSLAIAMRATLHISAKGDNDHHIIESIFKSFALVLKQAISRDERYLGIIPSSKGVL